MVLIGFDGIDGCGKTTLAKRIESSEFGLECVYTHCRFPMSPHVKEMYSILHRYRTDFRPLELFAKDMHYRFLQMPRGKIILADRTFLSLSIFYEEISNMSKIRDPILQEKIEELKRVHNPRLNILLFVDPNIALRRIIARRGKLKPVEELEFMGACEERFEKIRPSEEIMTLDTNNQTEERIYEIVAREIKKIV